MLEEVYFAAFVPPVTVIVMDAAPVPDVAVMVRVSIPDVVKVNPVGLTVIGPVIVYITIKFPVGAEIGSTERRFEDWKE